MRFFRILYMISNPDPSATWVHLLVYFVYYKIHFWTCCREKVFCCPLRQLIKVLLIMT